MIIIILASRQGSHKIGFDATNIIEYHQNTPILVDRAEQANGDSYGFC